MNFKKSVHSLSAFLFMAIIMVSCNTMARNDQHSSIPIPKNIIILIGDGMGYNHVKAANFFSYGYDRAQVYEGDDWVKLSLATYSSVMSVRNGDTIYSTGYNPRAAASNPQYVRADATDSGAAGTALSTGKKTYNGSIGLGIRGDTLIHISQAAKALGKATGVVSSVPLSHATPAAFVAHNNHRNNYAQIAQYMFFHTATDVIMATGNPDFNEDGKPAKMNPQYVGGQEIWDMLKTNDGRTEFVTSEGTFRVQDATGNGQRDPWSVIQTREEFQKMATGQVPNRVLGVPQVYSTLQNNRTSIEGHTLPFQTPLNEGVATLEEMTKAALNVLSQNKNGFFVMIEGGAIDWAGHSNNSARAIEEQIDFNNSIKAAVEWVEKNSNWNETLIIVTSDHECGYLTGPGEPNPIYGPVTNTGKGNLPAMQWNHGGHTNKLVPFYAKGKGAELFNILAGENDPQFGRFIQNTDMPATIFMMWGKPEIKVHRLNN